MVTVEKISTGCASLDNLLNGGIEKGVITNIYGEAGAGKSNLCLQLVANALNRGESIVFVDTEASLSVERLNQLTEEPDLDRVALVEPKTFEEQRYAFRQLEDVVREQDASLIIVDSLVALYRLQLQDGRAEEANQELATELATLSKIARSHNIPVVVTNQVYHTFDTDELQVVGKDVPMYWAKALIRLEKAEDGKRKAVVEKHRAIPEGKEAGFIITENGLEPVDENRLRIF